MDLSTEAELRPPERNDNFAAWPVLRRTVLDWIMNETSQQRFVDNLFVEMCERLNGEGVPIARATLHFRIDHPEWMGARILWKRGMPPADIQMIGYGVQDTSEFVSSPVYEIKKGARQVRQRLEELDPDAVTYSLYKDLAAEGFTDYVAWPLEHTLGKRHIVTFATQQPGGFLDEDIAYLLDLMPALALVSEIRIKNRLARTLLETYVGPHASELILAGATTRGSGVTVGAAILICDLRDFTAISDAWPRDDVIELLNGYFDAMSEPIEKHGGEILKFMGDGLLAIFPLNNPNACTDLLKAIVDSQAAMVELNAAHIKAGREALRYGVGVHVGDVMYGNIGSRRRLDFTVIGPAVNLASRIETLTKEVHRPVLLSREFAEMAGCMDQVEELGFHPVKGLVQPIEVFAFSGDGYEG